MKRLQLIALAILAGGWTALHAQVEQRGLPDWNPGDPDYSLLTPWSGGKAQAKRFGKQARTTLPDHVNNFETIYFPPAFNQDGGSCGSAADVGYQFTHEINAYRRRDGSVSKNRFPTHFTWLVTWTGSSKLDMMRGNGVPDADTYGGTTYSKFFGSQDYDDNNFGWMQGYDRWFNAMFNRVTHSSSVPLDTRTEEGRELVKRWLFNHNGDESFGAGGVMGIGCAAGPYTGFVPRTPANIANGTAGKYCVKAWNHTYNHAMTIAGYDDRIEFDLDSNGVAGEEDKDERGAWIIVNSWGQGYCNGGWIYCPYKLGGPLQPWQDSYFQPGMYYIRKVYRPLVTLKILMDYAHRSEICLGAGVAEDLDAEKPEKTIFFEHFKYSGNGANDGTDPAIPMLGNWTDGLHYEPMEFGYDLTDLTDGYDRTKPLKYFFFINSKPTAKGKGNIYAVSLINYEIDRQGIEMPFQIDTVAVLNGGKTTMLSLVATGEQLFRPLNTAIRDGALLWTAPQASTLPLRNYYVYADNELLDSVAAGTTRYELPAGMEGSFCVSAHYRTAGGYDGESAKSMAVSNYSVSKSEDNLVCVVKNSGFQIPDIFNSPVDEATFEFWLKPYTTTNYNQQIGPGWGTFLMHTTSTGAIYYGWDTSSGNRSAASTRHLNAGRWSHIAVTVKGNVMTLYVNGLKKSECVSKSFSGLSAFGMLTFGKNSNWMNGELDEVRVWSTCRSLKDILTNKDMPIANPAAHRDLVAYFQMDTIMINGQRKLRDCAGGHHAFIFDDDKVSFTVNNTMLQKTQTLEPTFAVAAGPHYAGQPVKVTAQNYVNVASRSWSVPDAGIEGATSEVIEPIFAAAGTYPVTLKVTDAAGNESEATVNVEVSPAPQPVIDFRVAKSQMFTGDHFSFVNTSTGYGITYRWIIPDAEEPEVQATNASAVFNSVGTHDVTLEATCNGQTYRVTKQVSTSLSAPIARFNVTPDVVIKGQPVYLEDASQYEPTHWLWRVTDGVSTTAINGQNSSYTPTHPGVYNVSLTARNNVGRDEMTQAKAFLVANADSKTGLNFTGDGQLLTFDNPLGESSRYFTIDWWMNPRKLDGAFTLTANDGAIRISTSETGAMTFATKTKSGASPEGYVIPGEWHHYAVTYGVGKVSFYRDGVLVLQSSTSFGMTAIPFGGTFSLGAEQGGMNTQIDEFRIWGKTLVTNLIKSYCNAPILNVDSVSEVDKLALYYRFDEGSGHPQDLTSGHRTGVRSGFGPDGDAWSLSKGVFTLNFDAPDAQAEDVTDAYLTNYKRPFYSTGKSINKNIATYVGLEYGTARSTWRVENAVVTPNASGDVTTGMYVNRNKNNDMCIEVGWNGFASQLANHMVYQTVTLPEGAYRLTCNVDPSNGTVRYGTTYLVASLADSLPAALHIDDALSYVEMSDEAQALDFFMDIEQHVSLGMNINLSGSAGINIISWKLEKLPYTVLEADGLTGVHNAQQPARQGLVVKAVPGGILVQTDDSRYVDIVTPAGQPVFRDTVQGSTRIILPRGIFIVNGVKVQVK